MRKVWLIALIVLVGVPLLSSAKTKHVKGYEHSRGKEISVSEPLGWPTLVSAKSYLDANIESLPGMTVVKVKPYNPWWQFWGSLPATTTISVGGFPVDTKLHVYTRGYRDHAEVTSDKSGHLLLDVPSKEGQQFIIKSKPSTYHININGNLWNLFAKGGDCKDIGTWNATTKTCTLNTDVNRDGNRTIAIEDDNITLDGNGHKLIGVGSDDGVYTDMSNVTVKNLDVSGFARGIVYVASHGLILSPPTGGSIQSVTLANLAQNLHIEGMSDLSADSVTSIGADTGLFITDLNLDGFPTYGITITGSTIKNASTGAYIDNVDPITLTQNNWQGNGTDLTTVSSALVLALLPQRGNYWSKFTACTQDPAPANPNHCTNRYDVPGTGVGDTLPWACVNGWKVGVVCPRVTSPPTGSGQWGEISTSGGTALMYSDQALTIKIKTLPNEWALKVLDSSGDPVKIHDSTDNVDGYIKASDIKIASAGSARETELKNNAEVVYDTRDKRVPIILEAVNLYHNNPNGVESLYNPAGGLDNGDNFPKFISDGSVPKELLLAIIKKETGSHELNNEVCNDGLDGGMGIMQLTPYRPSGEIKDEPRGLGSGMRNIQRVGDCYSGSGWSTQTSNYYSNTRQGIFANIKDGYRVFQKKYNTFKDHIDTYTPQKDSWFDGDGISVGNTDLKTLLAVRGYRGFGPNKCFRFDNELEYPGLIADSLTKLSDTFTGVTYDNSDRLIEKLKLAEKNKVSIDICSPGDLSIIDGAGRKTGYSGGGTEYQIPNIVYDEISHKSAVILFPQESYRFSIKGDQAGLYSLYIVNYAVALEFKAISIPIVLNEVHEYAVDWSKLNSPDGVLIKVDTNGDGIFDRTLTSDSTLTADKFAKQSGKVTICHRPPGNPENARTISVGLPAVKAHLAHGDKLGECDNGRELESKNKDKDNGQKNEKSNGDKKDEHGDKKGEVKGSSIGKDKKDKHKGND